MTRCCCRHCRGGPSLRAVLRGAGFSGVGAEMGRDRFRPLYRKDSGVWARAFDSPCLLRPSSMGPCQSSRKLANKDVPIQPKITPKLKPRKNSVMDIIFPPAGRGSGEAATPGSGQRFAGAGFLLTYLIILKNRRAIGKSAYSTLGKSAYPTCFGKGGQGAMTPRQSPGIRQGPCPAAAGRAN